MFDCIYDFKYSAQNMIKKYCYVYVLFIYILLYLLIFYFAL